MPSVYHETEHQEILRLQADLRSPIRMHIPSAGAKLGYYVCIRVPAKSAQRLGGVVCRLLVAGRDPVDLTLRAGEGLGQGLGGCCAIASKAKGQVWAILARAMASRGDGVLTLEGLPDRLRRAHVLLCTWLRFVQSGQADDYIEGRKDPRWAPSGVPLGGIGCGKVEMCRDGRFRNFSGNNNQDMPFEDPAGLDGAFLAVEAEGSQRVLASRSQGDIAPCPRLHSRLAFPQARLSAPGVLAGLDVEVLLSGPIVPHDLKTSCLPGFLVRWTIRNRAGRPRRVRCRLAWPNLVGMGGGIGEPEKRIGYGDGYYRYWDAPDRPQVEAIHGRGFEAIRYANSPSDICPAADGYHFVAASTATGKAIPLLDPRRGGMACELRVGPRSSRSCDMAVVWDMPHWIDSLGVDRGHYWQNLHAGGASIIRHLLGKADAIFERAGELADLIHQGDLPDLLADRLCNCNYPLTTNSLLYRDGRFSVNEGPTEMGGCYGTLDQRVAAHPATQLLFPQLDRRELELFGEYQAPDGGVNHDLGGGHLERGAAPTGWPDLTCDFILQNALHAWNTGRQDFEAVAYERSVKAMRRHAQWARQGNGLAQLGPGRGTSYDAYQYHGSSPYLGTLWLAALHVMRKWACLRGDGSVVAEVDALAPAAVQRMEADLWNGQYYRAWGSAGGPASDNCHAGMLAGQWYARALAGQDVLPADRLASCARSLLKLNASRRFAIPPDEVAPDGQLASQFGWLPYVEAFCVAPLASLRHKAALPLWRRMLRHMTAGDKTPCDTRLMYLPTGEPAWGAYYMTAPASWIVYQALLDFVFHPAQGVLRLAPQLSGSFPVIHPTFWAVGRRQGRRVSLDIRKVFEAKLTVRWLEVPGEVRAVTLDGRPLTQAQPHGLYKRFAIVPVRLRPDARLSWDAS
jgi:uncharacterized protein (DUF608 family)